MDGIFRDYNPTAYIVDSYDYAIFGRNPTFNPDGSITVHESPMQETINKHFPTTGKPIVYPPMHEEKRLSLLTCRLLSITYKIDICVHVDNDKLPTYFGSIPHMVGSRYFKPPPPVPPTDGFFVVNGRELVLICQEEHRHGSPVFQKFESNLKAYVKSYSAKFDMLLYRKKGVFVHIPSHSSSMIPIQDMLVALNEHTPLTKLLPPEIHQVVNAAAPVSPDPVLSIAKLFSYNVSTTQTAAHQKVAYAIKNNLLTFLGDDYRQKAWFLVDTAKRLGLVAIGRLAPTNEQSLESKRIATPGILIQDLFNHAVEKKLLATINKKYSKLPLHKALHECRAIISTTCEHAFNTGKWFRKNDGMTREIKRGDSNDQAVSIVRQINMPVNRQNKHEGFRKIHASQVGFEGIENTPEGKNIGLTKFPAFTTSITTKGSVAKWVQIATAICKQPALIDRPKVKVNERIVALFEPNKVDEFLTYKKGSEDHPAIFVDELGDLIIDVEEGRHIRPVIEIATGDIVWIDPREQAKLLIRSNTDPPSPFYTHREIHDANMFSIEGTKTPYATHNQGPRVQLSVIMSKTGIGVATIDEYYKRENMYRLWYSQRPLAETMHARETAPTTNGLNVSVLFAAMPNGQEDSAVISRHFVEMAGLTCDAFKSAVSDAPPAVFFGGPVPRNEDKYRKLNPDTGIIETGEAVVDGDVLAVRYNVDGSFHSDFTYHDLLPRIKQNSSSSASPIVVEKIILRENKFENQSMIIRFRQKRPLCVGDKIVSRHSQKNIISEIKNREDLPFDCHGNTPDIVFNPHSIPSRLTIGQIIEALASTLIAYRPGLVCCDPTPFSQSFSMKEIQRELKELGMHPQGNTRYHNPHTGLPIEHTYFAGSVYYERLAHMVQDKAFSRSHGAIVPSTMQPTKGRANEGGLRSGEMETLAYAAHGAGYFAIDKMLLCSDGVKLAVNDEGMLTNTEDTNTITTSYALVCFQQRLRVAAIDCKCLPTTSEL